MASITDVVIANMALSKVGARSTIESLDDPVPTANQCKLWYDPSREQALKVFNWSFAKKRQALAASTVAPPAGLWGFRYLYPVDCIVARLVVNPLGRQADPIPYEIETVKFAGADVKTILTDHEEAVLKYTFDVMDTTLFTTYFTELLATLLASKIAFSLTGKLEIANARFQEYLGLVNGAPVHDANEGVEEKPDDAEHIQARTA